MYILWHEARNWQVNDGRLTLKWESQVELNTLWNISFHTPPHDSCRVLWFHAGRPYICVSICRQSLFSFLDYNLSKYQWIFAKLGMCIDIEEIWFGIANGQISSIFDRVICSRHARIFISRWYWVNVSGFLPNLVCELILWRSGLELLMGKFHQFLTVICLRHAHIFLSWQILE